MAGSKPRASDEATDLAQHLADLLNDTGLSEIEIEREGLRVRVARTVSVQASAAAPQAGAGSPVPSSPTAGTASAPAHDGEVIKSPMVGTVYLQAQPGTPPFVKLGDEVAAGQTLLLVEAMKTMNPIPAPRGGILLEILVADSQPVEYGEPLVVLG
ncbi:MAG: acetyl-CoA carboxylase biotin carboxyl carrier protein subunit [Caulobacteraceae bacterium]